MLTRYFKSEDLNTNFKSTYQVLEYVLNKYNIANGDVRQFAGNNFYNLTDPRPVLTWKKNNKVPNKLWNLLHKNLVLLRVSGKIKDSDIMSLEDLEQEFKFLSHK